MMNCMEKLLFTLFFPVVCSKIINLEILKYVDITSQLVKIDMTILFRNEGLTQIQDYNYIVDPDVMSYYVEFYSTEKLTYQRQNDTLYIVHLQKPILPKANGFLKVEIIYLDMIKTLIDEERKERTVHYSGNLYFYSPYESSTCIVMYHINKLEMLEISEQPTSRNVTDFMYEFKELQSYAFKKISFFYVNDVPFFVVRKLDRTIDVSHLGYILIEDNVELVNEGPKLTEIYQPPFKRLPQILHTYLPASATNIKLFDDIGNNSKSTVIHQHTYITLRFEARYPLRQSWKTKYILQYDVPVHEYLRRNENFFVLKMRVVDHVLPNAIIGNVRTRVVLPEGSEIKSVTSSEEVIRDQDERMNTALSFNRPTVTFVAKNLPEECVPEFVITYSTPSYGLFKPALLISAYIEVILISCVAFRRIDMYLRIS